MSSWKKPVRDLRFFLSFYLFIVTESADIMTKHEGENCNFAKPYRYQTHVWNKNEFYPGVRIPQRERKIEKHPVYLVSRSLLKYWCLWSTNIREKKIQMTVQANQIFLDRNYHKDFSIFLLFFLLFSSEMKTISRSADVWIGPPQDKHSRSL